MSQRRPVITPEVLFKFTGIWAYASETHNAVAQNLELQHTVPTRIQASSNVSDPLLGTSF